MLKDIKEEGVIHHDDKVQAAIDEEL